MDVPHETRAPAALPRAGWVVLALGLALSLLMVWRSQLDGDAYNMLRNGWVLAAEGKLLPYGNPLSAAVGGREPGPMTSLLVGLPLLVWHDYRAPSLLILLLHLASWIVLDRVLAAAVTRRERFLFLLIYWLAPWRLFFSGFLWNPNYLFLAGAIHAWTAWRQRAHPSFWASLVHVLTLGCAVQLHPSPTLLGFASALLVVRRRMKLHWSGAIAGGLLVLAMLVPWMQAVQADPSLLPHGSASGGRTPAKVVHNLVRGFHYWASQPSLSVPTRIAKLDFGPALGDSADRILRPLFWFLTQVLFAVTWVPFAVLLAGAWRRRRRHRANEPLSSREWLRSYATLVLLGGCIAFAISPTTVMMWQVLVTFHSAALLAALRLAELRGLPWGPWARRSIAVLVTGYLVLDLAAAIAAPVYRRGGYGRVYLHHDPEDPMIRGLGIAGRCDVLDPRLGPPLPVDHRPTWRGGTRGAGEE